MKPLQHNTLPAGMTTPAEIVSWQTSLQLLHARLASCFARPEPYARALSYVQAILSDISRKNGWQIAEQAREATPYGMQRLLSQAVWDADAVRDIIRVFVLHLFGHRPLIIAIDETGFLKRGKHSAGVGLQHYGPTGDVRNCQVGVFLSLVTEIGHTLIDRELYLSTEWTDDLARRAQVGIPPSRTFRTKPQLALLMLQRLWQAQLTISWVVADSVYGSNPELRGALEVHQQPYVMAVSCTEPVVLDLPGLGVRRLEVQELPALLASDSWQTLAMSEGTKGPRLFDWACLPIWHQGGDDGWHSVLLRRPLSPDVDPTYYLVFAPPTTSLSAKVTALGGRWRIEEDFENAKDLGLDHYEVRSFVGWYRHITLMLLALAFLTSVVLTARTASSLPSSSVSGEAAPTPVSTDLCPLSVPEARRLQARLFFPPPSGVSQVLAWSHWRRRHQYRACLCHCRRRLKAG
jgi:SRSO17 transposase